MQLFSKHLRRARELRTRAFVQFSDTGPTHCPHFPPFGLGSSGGPWAMYWPCKTQQPDIVV